VFLGWLGGGGFVFLVGGVGVFLSLLCFLGVFFLGWCFGGFFVLWVPVLGGCFFWLGWCFFCWVFGVGVFLFFFLFVLFWWFGWVFFFFFFFCVVWFCGVGCGITGYSPCANLFLFSGGSWNQDTRAPRVGICAINLFGPAFRGRRSPLILGWSMLFFPPPPRIFFAFC